MISSDLEIKDTWFAGEALMQILDDVEMTDEEKHDEILKNHMERFSLLVPKHILQLRTSSQTVSYFIGIDYGIGDYRRYCPSWRTAASVLLASCCWNQFRIGLSRMERVVRERMSVQDDEILTPQG